MTNRRHCLVAISLGLALVPSPLSAQNTAKREWKEMSHISVTIDLTDVHSSDVLEYIARTYHVPCGVQINSEMSSETHDERISLHLSQVDIGTALDALVAANPRYRWEASEGVIHLSPAAGAGGVLDTRIANVHIQNRTQEQAEQEIVELPEIQAELNRLHLQSGNFEHWSINKYADAIRISVDLSNTTLRQLLDCISRQTNYWSVSRFGNYLLINLGEGPTVASSRSAEKTLQTSPK